MKKKFSWLIIPLILLAFSAPAQEPVKLASNTAIIAGGGVSTSVCSESTDYVGSTSTYSTASSLSAGYMGIHRAVATCGSGATSCKLATAKMYHNSTTQSEAVICVYPDSSNHADATSPVSTDALLGQSNAIDFGTTTGQKTAVASGTYTVTAGSYLWIGFFISSTAILSTRETNTQSLFYKNLSASGYPTCPATLGGSWVRSAAHGPWELHFTLGP